MLRALCLPVGLAVTVGLMAIDAGATEPGRVGYEEYDEILALVDAWEADYPGIARVMDLPWMQSLSGQPIVVLQLSSRLDAEPGTTPGVVMTGGTHGDEWIGTAVLLRLTERLLLGYGNDARLTRMVDQATLYVVPVTNPDFFHIAREEHGIDANRVFPYPGNEAEPPVASARGMLQLFDTVYPDASIDFHGMGGLILHPWGYTCTGIDDPADAARFRAVGAAMAAGNGYLWGDVCNTIYQASGMSQDGYYHRYRTLSFAIETGASAKKPPEAEIEPITEECAGAAWALIDYVIDDDGAVEPGDDTGDSGDSATGDGSDPSDDVDGASSDDAVDGCGCAMALGGTRVGPAAWWSLFGAAWMWRKRRRGGQSRRRQLTSWALLSVTASGSACTVASGDDETADETGATAQTGLSTEPAEVTPHTPPPADCGNLPPLPATVQRLDFVPGCEDFTFDRGGNLVCITKERAYVKVPYGGPTSTIVPRVGNVDAASYTRGIRYLPGGDLVIADPATSSLLRMADDGTGLSTVLSGVADPNGIAIGRRGEVYLSLLTGEIWRVDVDAGTREVIHRALEPGKRYDGISLGVDFDTLFFNSEDDLEVFRMGLGSNEPPQWLVTIESDHGTSVPPFLDGMAVDECGNVYIAEMQGVVHRLAPDGTLSVVADMTEHYPAFIAALNFGSGRGGWDAHTLYVMIIQGGMFALDVGVAGKFEPHLAQAPFDEVETAYD